MFPRKVSKFHKSSFPWCHDRPRTAKLGMNFIWIPPPSTSHGQVNSGEKKLCRSTGSLKETRSRATQEPTSPSSSLLLFLSFCPPPSMRFDFISASLSPSHHERREAAMNPFLDPSDTLEAPQSLAQCRKGHEGSK